MPFAQCLWPVGQPRRMGGLRFASQVINPLGFGLEIWRMVHVSPPKAKPTASQPLPYGNRQEKFRI